MEPQKRRPPNLSDAIFKAPAGPANAGAVSGCRAELQRCVQRLQEDMEGALERHQEDLMRCLDHWVALQRCGWRSAGSEGLRSSNSSLGSEPRVGIAGIASGGLPSAIPGSQPATPKLQPPPAGRTPVRCMQEQLRAAAADFKRQAPPPPPSIAEVPVAPSAVEVVEAEPAASPRSLTSSTRSGSNENAQACNSSGKASDAGSSPGPPGPDSLAAGAVAIAVAAASDARPDATAPTLPPGLPVSHSSSCSSMSLAPNPTWSAELPLRPRAGTAPAAAGLKREQAPEVRWRQLLRGKRSRSKGYLSPLSNRKLAMSMAQQTWLQRFTRSTRYKFGTTLFVALNALFIMWETEHRSLLASSYASLDDIDHDNLYFGVMGTFFCIFLILDVVLRLVAEKQSFFHSREWAWNVFDLFVGLTATAEVIVQWYQYSVETASCAGLRIFLRKFSMLRIIRVLGIIRTARTIRVLRFIRELRLMVFSLTGSLRSLAWAVVLMLLIFLVFGVFFTDGAISYLVQHNAMQAEETKDLRRYFGTLSAATISLYMAMSGGEDWAPIMRSLDPLPMEYQFLFLTFVTFAILALLNVVTAVFVGTAMQQSQADRELVVQQELEQKGEFVALMQQVFEELDTNSSGALSLEEFEKHIEDEKILAYLRTQQIDISQVRTLFTLLDVDQTGEVDIDEFVGGCVRLRGGATTMDLAVLKYQVEWILHNVQSTQRLLAEQVQAGVEGKMGSARSRELLQ